MEHIFFTVNLLQWHDNNLLIREINLLRDTVQQVRSRHPFQIDAWVVLPDHLHCVWTLPPDDSNFSLRWRLIKSGFSRSLPKTERRSKIRKAAGERGVWQRHIDYVHVNPLKHGYVKRVSDWPYSTFHKYVKQGIYPLNWCGDIKCSVGGDE